MQQNAVPELTTASEAGEIPGRAPLRFYFVCWGLFLCLSPVYIFESGNPQPADFFMALLIMIMATGYVLRIALLPDLYVVAGAFLSYAAFVNLFWWPAAKDFKFVLSALYYPYNFAIFVMVVSMLRQYRDDFVKLTRLILIVVILMEIVLSVALQGPIRYREAVTFNNPNQLAYWSLIVACCYLILKGDQRMTLVDFFVLIGAGYLVMLSGSRGGLIGLLILFIVAPLFQGWDRAAKVGVLLLGFGGAVASLGGLMVVGSDAGWVSTYLGGVAGQADPAEKQAGLASALERLGDIGGRSHDSIAGRGYDRLWLYPEHLLLGAGEGAYDRFTRSAVGKLEIHSTFGTVLFSYGIIGFVLFSCLLYMIFRGAPLKHLVYAMPIAFYSLTHQGLRFSLLWVFLALVAGMARFGGPLLGRRQQPAVSTVGETHGTVLRKRPIR